jgi:hypothetical protein
MDIQVKTTVELVGTHFYGNREDAIADMEGAADDIRAGRLTGPELMQEIVSVLEDPELSVTATVTLEVLGAGPAATVTVPLLVPAGS